MKEDRELGHMCKFCSKSFPCGRSLGGHMRSHMLNNSSVKTEEKLSRGKFSSSATPPEASNQTGYGLRENPKKTCRFADSKIETSAHGKFCKECGKGFQSWKALFGHMKRHSDKDGNAPEDQNGLGEEDSWISSQSDNESENPNRRRRSGRRANTRYSAMAQTASSSLSFANNNGSSSVSEMEHEQEEVALCLMMLSRDVGHWGGLNSVAGSSDNSSVFSDDPPWRRPDRIAKIDWKKNRASGYLRNGLKDTRDFEFLENHRTDFEDSEIELGKGLIGETELDHSELFFSKCGDSGKRKFHHSYSSPEIGTDSKSDEPPEALPKYKCATCSKTFHSYQALGGHRASHKKIKGCFASRIEGSENSIEDDSKNGNSIDLLGIGVETSTTKFVLKKSEGHECPICFRVFLSGQALGGHKRSHLIGGSQVRNDRAAVLNDQRPTPEIRDLLDLNLPAPVEDEGNANGIGFKPWWVGNSHKHEPLVDLISN